MEMNNQSNTGNILQQTSMVISALLILKLYGIDLKKIEKRIERLIKKYKKDLADNCNSILINKK